MLRGWWVVLTDEYSPLTGLYGCGGVAFSAKYSVSKLLPTVVFFKQVDGVLFVCHVMHELRAAVTLLRALVRFELVGELTQHLRRQWLVLRRRRLLLRRPQIL